MGNQKVKRARKRELARRKEEGRQARARKRELAGRKQGRQAANSLRCRDSSREVRAAKQNGAPVDASAAAAESPLTPTQPIKYKTPVRLAGSAAAAFSLGGAFRWLATKLADYTGIADEQKVPRPASAAKRRDGRRVRARMSTLFLLLCTRSKC